MMTLGLSLPPEGGMTEATAVPDMGLFAGQDVDVGQDADFLMDMICSHGDM